MSTVQDEGAIDSMDRNHLMNGDKAMNHNQDENIFEVLGFKKEEAANLKIRAELLIMLREYINGRGLKQKEASERLGIPQPDVSSIMNAKIDKFTIDKLVNLLTRIGYELKIESNNKRRIFSVIDGDKIKKYKTVGNKYPGTDVLEA